MTDSKENYTRKENSGRDLSHPTMTTCRIPSFHSALARPCPVQLYELIAFLDCTSHHTYRTRCRKLRFNEEIWMAYFTGQFVVNTIKLMNSQHSQTGSGTEKRCSHNLQSGHPAWWSADNCSIFPTVNIFRLFRSKKRTGRGNQKCLKN